MKDTVCLSLSHRTLQSSPKLLADIFILEGIHYGTLKLYCKGPDLQVVQNTNFEDMRNAHKI
jgi:hypothetical protein